MANTKPAAAKEPTSKTTAPASTPVSGEAAEAATTAPAGAPSAVAVAPAAEDEAAPQRVSTCVVNDGQGYHVGDAVNGLVCSYHAMHYDRNGNRR